MWLDGGHDYLDGLEGELKELACFAILLRRHAPESVGDAAPGTRRSRPAARVAAAVLLVAALVIGLSVGLSQSSSGNSPVPLGGLTKAPMPLALYDEVLVQAGTSGDPYPHAPALWVETTAAKVDEYLVAYNFPSQKAVPGSLHEWVAEIDAHFYGDPARKMGPFSSMIFAWVPSSELRRYRMPMGGEASGFPAVPLDVLERLGTVHRQYIRRPHSAPAVSSPGTGAPTTLPRGVSAMLQGEIVLYRPFNRTLTLGWTGLTAGELRSKVPWSAVPANIPADWPVWAVEVSEQLCCQVNSTGGFPTDWLLVWPSAHNLSTYDTSSRKGSSDLLGITRLAQLGPVHWIRGDREVIAAVGLP